MPGPDQRIHARIHVSTEIEVATPSGTITAELRDLSKGGARFHGATDDLAKVGDSLELYLPSLSGAEIVVMAELIRIIPERVGFDYAVRFDIVEPAMRQALLDLLEVLLSTSGGGRHEHARVARRIEIRFGPVEELRAILEDISAGGLMMTVGEALVLYEEVDVTVPDLAGVELLILHARVVNQRSQIRDGHTSYQVGLEFGSMRPEAKRLLDELLRSVNEELPDTSADPTVDAGQA